tara:strand:+ start:274 stop:576 length:303 start_codon:yes stop_codon:yes gene_type:complete
MPETENKPCSLNHVDRPPFDPGIRVDAHLSLPVLVSWIAGLLIFVATVSSMFAEQQKRLDYTDIRQTRLEQSISKIESLISTQNDLLIRLNTKMEASEKK